MNLRPLISPRFARILLCLLVTLLVGAWSQQVHAQCAVQQEEGNWVNSDPNTPSLTRAVLRFTCQDQVLNGQPYPPGPPWHMHLWGKCHPTDCDWGEVGAENVTIGSRTYVRATFNQGFATRHVYADMSLFRTGQLWIWMWTDFSDPGRPDYESQNWFVRR
ncbi:hypothetical protein [Variovorax sp. J22R115]|uniref:hypothetical protein n=1 Tax=Variovorax sp. J22R115 TaxID=3053509 RepID=UPI002576A50E|nr:hypothetical protein [Variovorax sp. J22R115]MDM0053814.1 hypothetical protein [Variovorax sp. J22R115]